MGVRLGSVCWVKLAQTKQNRDRGKKLEDPFADAFKVVHPRKIVVQNMVPGNTCTAMTQKVPGKVCTIKGVEEKDGDHADVPRKTCAPSSRRAAKDAHS